MSTDAASLIDALGAHLHQLGVAHYDPDNDLPDGLTVPAVGLLQLPQSHSSAIAITPYWTDPDPFTVKGQTLHMVQLLFREPGPDPRPVLRREQQVRDLITSMLPARWPGGVTPLSVSFSSAAPADLDEDGSWTRAANFAIRLNPGD